MSGPRPRVFVTRQLPSDDALARLERSADTAVWPDEDPPPPADLRAALSDREAVLTMINDRVDAPLLEACPRLLVVSNMAVGYDNIDVVAATERGVLVTNTPGVLTEATADIAFALILAAARRLNEGAAAIRSGAWGEWHPSWLLGREIAGSTLGIVGPGRIGRAVARRGEGFGMRVLYAGRTARRVEGFPGDPVAFDELLARADVVSVHVPLTAETTGLFDAAAFGQMQPHAIFVNTARGGVVDQPALIDALERGEIGAAGLDVMTPEPLPPDHPLLEAPRLTLTPHLGSATGATRARMAAMAVDGVLAALEGRRPEHLVNPEALDAAATRRVR